VSRSKRRRVGIAGRLLAAAAALALAAAAALWAFLPDPGALAARFPQTTALVEQRRAEARREGRPFRPELRPVPLDRISPHLAAAVVLSEDAAFFGHSGFDWAEIRNAAEQNLRAGRTVRGASTITQQLAKNLWLGTERSWTRKLKEAVLAVKLERALSKRRLLALYLGVVEWGDGVFGAEPAARHWFGASAADLGPAQAAALAAMLPAPRRAALSPAPRWLARRARRVLDLMARTGKIGAAEHALARLELEALLGSPADLPEEEPPED
jgi:monofunctional biosynthetic peptidoglycan transglycosylase